MTEIATKRAKPAPALEGVAWFALMVGMWSAFYALLIASPETLADMWRRLTELPLAAEIAMWILVFPWALGIYVWERSWDEWVRLLLVALFGAVWMRVSAPKVEAAG